MKTMIAGMMALILFAPAAFAAYHHEGEVDSARFIEVYPDKAGSKLDHCALCHTGGRYEQSGKTVSLGSCQWCHYTYGYDKKGNIGDTLNPYGKAYLDNGRSAAAVRAVESLDSDGDGFPNKTEIEAVRFPGNTGDDPNKKAAPSKVYTLADLETMSKHAQFLLMNTTKSGDFYAEYTGVDMESLLRKAGMLDSATGITVFAPDGWAQYHPLTPSTDPQMYPVINGYPSSVYYYDIQAEGWCDYSAPSCAGRNNGDAIVVAGGLRAILAYKRDGVSLSAGKLTASNKLDGEGPYRVVVPQKTPSPPDQASTAANQDVIWPYNASADHNAGACTRSAVIIRVEPLPDGTTDIDVMEAGWNYIDQGKIVIYGAISQPEDDGDDTCFISTLL